MAKIRMAQVAGLPVRTLRRMVGIPAHRPSAFNSCIGASLRGKTYAKPPAGMGGQKNPAVHQAFTNAVKGCAGR